MESSTLPARLRSLYRQFLRELPPRISSSSGRSNILSAMSPMHARIRDNFTIMSLENRNRDMLERIEIGEQFAAYLKAQRNYTNLIERYNPGMGMDEAERVRLSARRVGMNLPIEHKDG